MVILCAIFVARAKLSDAQASEPSKYLFPVCANEVAPLAITAPRVPVFPTETPQSENISVENQCSLVQQNSFSELKPTLSFYIQDFPLAYSQRSSEEAPAHLGDISEKLKSCQLRTAELHKSALFASNDVYSLSAPIGFESPDLEHDTFVFNDDSGVKAYVLRPSTGNRNQVPIIAFAGTEGLVDAAHDTSLGASQVERAKDRVLAWIKTLRNEGYNEVILTGHSLGGGIAQVMAAMIDGDPKFKVHLVTFNAFGGESAVRDLKINFPEDQNIRERSHFQPTRDAVNYRMPNDLVSRIGNHFGEVRTFQIKTNKGDILKNHSISTLMDRMDKDEPDLLAKAVPEEGGEPWYLPISAVTRGVSRVQRAVNRTEELAEEVTEGARKWLGSSTESCSLSTSKKVAADNGETCKNGNALRCFELGSFAKSRGKIGMALDLFSMGCDLCHLDSCVQYGALYKNSGYRSDAFRIEKKGCDLGDGWSCIEAGKTLIEKDPKSLESDYVFLGCAHGEQNLCQNLPDRYFAERYLQLKKSMCQNAKSKSDCALLYWTSREATLKEGIDKRIWFLKTALKRGGNFHVLDSTGTENPIRRAIKAGDIEVVKLFLEEGGSRAITRFDEKMPEGLTALQWAVKYDQLDIVKLLLQSGADIRRLDSSGNSVLHHAAGSPQGHQVLDFLLSGKYRSTFDLNQANDLKRTPLFLAAESGSAEAVHMLLRNGAMANVKSENPPLLAAVSRGNLDIVTQLIRAEAPVNWGSSNGQTPLTVAAEAGNLEMVKLLVKAKAQVQPNPEVLNGGLLDLPLSAAARSGNLELFGYLLSQGAVLDSASSSGETPLMSAAEKGRVTIVNEILSRKINVNAKNLNGETALLLGVRSGNYDLVKSLIDHGAEKFSKSKFGTTPFLAAVENGDRRIIEKVYRGDLLNAQDSQKRSPALIAARFGKISALKFLKNKGANMSVANAEGDTPILAAAQYGGLEALRFVAENGGRLGDRNAQGESVLSKAVRSENGSVIQYVLEKTSRILSDDERNHEFKKALELGVSHGNITMIEPFFQAGFKLDLELFRELSTGANAKVVVLNYLRTKLSNPFDLDTRPRQRRTELFP